MNYVRPWKIISLFDMLSDTYAKFYHLSEHVAVDERVIFKQYISKKHKCFGINIYKLCNMTGGYTYDMSIYLEKDWQKKNLRINMMTCTPKLKNELNAGGFDNKTLKIEGR
jgi:hypothetical protein